MVRRLDQIAIGLVDRDHIGQLHNTFLDALQLVARRGREKQEKQVGHLGDRRLRLADADRLDDDDIEPRRLADQHTFAGSARHAAKAAPRRRWPDEGRRMARKFFHAGLIAQDRAAAHPGGGIDRQHRNPVPLPHEVQAERFDEARFTDSGRA